MAVGFKWVQYSIGISPTSVNVGLGTTILVKSVYADAIKSLDFGVINRQGFSTANSVYAGLKFYGFTPNNLRIYLKSPFADSWALSAGSTSSINQDLIASGWDFRYYNIDGPTEFILNPCSGVSTASIYPDFVYSSNAFVGIFKTAFGGYFNYLNDDHIGIGSRFLVREEKYGIFNGLYYISSSYTISTIPVWDLARTSDLSQNYQINNAARVGVVTATTQYYGIYPNVANAQIGINSIWWVPQPPSIVLADSVVAINANTILGFCTVSLSSQNYILQLNDKILLIGQNSSYDNGQYVVSNFVSGFGYTVAALTRTGIITGTLCNQLYSYISQGIFSGQRMLIKMGIPTNTTLDYGYALGGTTINFTSYTAYNAVISSPSYWPQVPYQKFNTWSTLPYFLDTHPLISNYQVRYSDVLALNMKPPTWQIDADVRGWNLVAEFETSNV